jgi:hypothetical protein
MATDQINLTAGLKSLFFVNTATMLGLDPTATATKSMIRQTWPQQGAPGFTINSDYVFLRIVPVSGHHYNKIREVQLTPITTTQYFNQLFSYSKCNIVSENLNQSTSYTRVWQVFWECYGPDAMINAVNIRDQLFYDGIHDLFVANNLYLMSEVDDPIRAPENFMGQWWERWDLSAQFYESVIRNTSIATIAEVPVVSQSNDSAINTVTITNE